MHERLSNGSPEEQAAERLVDYAEQHLPRSDREETFSSSAWRLSGSHMFPADYVKFVKTDFSGSLEGDTRLFISLQFLKKEEPDVMTSDPIYKETLTLQYSQFPNANAEKSAFTYQISDLEIEVGPDYVHSMIDTLMASEVNGNMIRVDDREAELAQGLLN